MRRAETILGMAALVLGVCVLAAQPAVAQAQGPRQGNRVGRERGLAASEIERLFDGYVIMQAQDSLKLTDAQFPEFTAKLKALQETRRRTQQARRLLVADLGRALNATPVAEPELRDLLAKLHDLQLKSAEDLQKAYDGIDRVLDLAQQARFRVFEETVERRKFDLVLRARGRAQRMAPAPER